MKDQIEQTYNDIETSRLTGKYCCNKCHSSLMQYPAPERRWFIRCIKCNENNGFIMRSTARIRENQADQDRLEMKTILQFSGDVFSIGNPKKKFDESSTLKVLGF